VCVCARARACVCTRACAGLYKLPQEFARPLLYSHPLNVVCRVCLFADDVSGSAAPLQTVLTLMLTVEH
jgi:hypothetical protein